MAKKRARVPGIERVSLDIKISRDVLIKIFDDLVAPSPSPLTRSVLRGLLVDVIDQMPPKRDGRVRVQVWQLAMLAAALVKKKKAKPEVAVLTAIEMWAPSRENDSKFRETVSRTFRKLRSGTNNARSLLLDIPDEVVEYAATKLPKKIGNKAR